MNNNISLNSIGGVGRGIQLPISGKYHGELFLLVLDGIEDGELYSWSEIKHKWIPISGSGGVNGGIFITDITPLNSADNVGNKVYVDDLNVQLQSVVSSTNLVRVHVLVITGHSSYKPKGTINEVEIANISPTTDKPLFTGSVDLDMTGQTQIIAEHEDGAKHIVEFKYENLPKILSSVFAGNYPTTNGIVQTELKENDPMQLNVKTDVPIIKVELADFGCYKNKVFNIANLTDATVTGIIAARGTAPQFLGAKLRVQKASGAWSDWFETTSQGTLEKVYTVKLNNLYPSVSVSSVSYPLIQQALKDSESATISHTVTNYDKVLYECPNGELNIVNPNTYETNKTVSRISGDYNVSSPNFRIVATRNANGATTTVNNVVQIAHIEPTITVQEQYARLRSSETGSNYWIKLISNQKLLNTPTLNIPVGTWVGNFTTSDNLTYSRTISISDSDLKGTFNYLSMSATNLAGKPVTVINGNGEYVIGGMISRKLTFQAFQSTVSIGSYVEDINKLSVIDLSGYVFTYQPNLDNNPLTYTIVNSSGAIDSKGNYLRITDQAVVNQNSTATYYVFLEEGI